MTIYVYKSKFNFWSLYGMEGKEEGRQPTKNAYFGIVVIVQNPVDSIAICSSPFLHFFSRPLLLLVISVE